jgi:hypothetical protein
MRIHYTQRDEAPAAQAQTNGAPDVTLGTACVIDGIWYIRLRGSAARTADTPDH